MALLAVGLVLEFPLVLQWTFQVKTKTQFQGLEKRHKAKCLLVLCIAKQLTGKNAVSGRIHVLLR